MNIDRLKQIRDAILANPDHFNMEEFLNDDNVPDDPAELEALDMRDDDFIARKAGCGSAACIAGWAVSLFPNDLQQGNYIVAEDSEYVGEVAEDLLQLTPTQSWALFYHYADGYQDHLALALLEYAIDHNTIPPRKGRLDAIVPYIRREVCA